jgi:nicotinamidase-related amidase
MARDLEFHKEKAALLIVDMQNAFVDSNGSLSRMGLDTSRTKIVIEPIKRLKSACNIANIPVIYLQHVHRADGKDSGLIDKVFPPIFQLEHCKRNSWDAEIIPELKLEERDLVVEKYRFSGFFNTQLETVLRQLERDELIVCGIATNVCVESTVREAFNRDYNVFVPEETTASFFEIAEKASLENFRFAFARVVKLDEMIRKMTE